MSRKNVAFYIDYDKYGKEEAPAILPFVQVLRDRGHRVEFITAEKELLDKVKGNTYDCVALSVLSSLELKEVLSTAIKIKKLDPRVVTILGGQGTTGIAGKLANAMGIDLVVKGEAELILPTILTYVKRGEGKGLAVPFDKGVETSLPKQQIEFFGKETIDLLLKDRVFYRSPITENQADALLGATFERRIVKGEEIRIFVPLSNIIFNTKDRQITVKGGEENAYERSRQSWEKEHPEKEFPLTIKEFAAYLRSYPTQGELNELTKHYPWEEVKKRRWRSISLYVQRGCNWGKCSYCGIKTPPGRRLEIPRVIDILEEAASNGIATVTFDDDQFVQDPKWVAKLCDEIIRHRLNKRLAFSAMIRVDAIKNLALLQKLYDANFSKLQIGVESFIPEKIRYFNKTPKGKEGEYVRKAKKLIFACLEIGIVPGVFIITTRPMLKHALLEIAEELTVISDIIKKAHNEYELLPTFSFNDMLMAYPGAPLFEKEGYKRMLAPLRPIEVHEDGKRKVKLEELEIPHAFKFKSPALANFIGNLMAISARRGIMPEIVNETLEHVEDLIDALEISAEHLDSDIGIAFEFIQELGNGRFAKNEIEQIATRINAALPEGRKIVLNEEIPGQVKLLLAHKILAPGIIKDAVKSTKNEEMLDFLVKELPQRLAEEKRSVRDKCKAINNNIIGVEKDIHRTVSKYLEETRERFKRIEDIADEKEFFRKTKEIRNRTLNLMDRVYPYLQGRTTLESLVEWISEFEERRLQKTR